MITAVRILAFLLCSQFVLAQSNDNPLDEKGKKHGLWKGYYQESKRPRYEGTFEHGKEVGVFYYYDDTAAKSVIASRSFNAGDNSCYTVFYDQNKNIVSEGKEINRLREGAWKYYHKASKVLMTLEYYKNGKLDGLKTVYYPSGKVVDETNYQNGVKEGVYKKYSEKGIVLEQSFFKNGQYEGEAVFKDPNDLVVAKGKFKNGKKVGKWQFFVNGKLESEENMDKQIKIQLKSDQLKKE